MKKKELRDRLQEAMGVRGLRAVDIVERTGIPKGTISYYISGKTEPKSDRLYILAQALDVNEAWLLGYDVPMTRTEDQKKNDQLAKLIVKMRADSEFYEAVLSLSSLADTNEGQYRGVVQLLSTFNK